MVFMIILINFVNRIDCYETASFEKYLNMPVPVEFKKVTAVELNPAVFTLKKRKYVI